MSELIKCSCCKEFLPVSSFNKNRSRPSGFHHFCRDCDREKQRKWKEKNPEKVKEARKKYRVDPQKAREYQLRVKYGFEPGDYEKRLEEQGGACFICHEKPEEGTYLTVDHCHTRGHVRKLLCNHCNAGLGQFRDNPQLLRKAAGYLEEHNGRTEGGCTADRS